MDNRDQTIFPKETTCALNQKRPRSQEDVQNSKAKKSKIHCNDKSIFPNKRVSINYSRVENRDDYDRNNSKVEQSRTNMQEFFTVKLNTTSENSEDLEEENETDISTAEHSLQNIIPSKLSSNQRNNTSSFAPTKCSSDVQLKKMRIPYSTTGNFPGNAKSEITLHTIENETFAAAIVADSTTNNASAEFVKQQDNGFSSTKYQEQKISSSEFYLTSTETFTEHKIDNELAANSLTGGEASNARRQPDLFVTQNLGMGLIQTLKFHFTSPETVSNNFSISDSIVTSQTSHSSDIFHVEEEEPEIPLKQLSNSFYVNLDDNLNLEETGNGLNTSEIIFEETENERFQAGTSTSEKIVKDKCRSEYVQQNQFQDNAETLNVVSDTERKNNQPNRNNKERVKRKGSCSSSYSDSNSESSQSNINSDLQIIKNRSKLNNKPKCSVTNSNNGIKTRKNEQRQKTNLQTIIKNTLKDKHPELCLQDDIGMRLEIFLWDMLYRIGSEAENLVLFTKKQHFDKRALKYAIKLSLEKLKKEADVISAKRNQ